MRVSGELAVWRPNEHHLKSVPRLQRKSFSSPDEIRRFPSGQVDIIHLDETVLGRFALGPGWRWSRDVQPTAATN